MVSFGGGLISRLLIQHSLKQIEDKEGGHSQDIGISEDLEKRFYAELLSRETWYHSLKYWRKDKWMHA